MQRTKWVYVNPDSIEIFGFMGVRGDKQWRLVDTNDTKRPWWRDPWDVGAYILSRAPRRAQGMLTVSPQIAVQLYLQGYLTKGHLDRADLGEPNIIHCAGVHLEDVPYQLVIDWRLHATPNRIS